MFTWTFNVILSLGVAVPLSAPTEWCLCEWEFSTLCTFLAPRLVFHASASSYPGTRRMILTWGPKNPHDDHHFRCIWSKLLGNIFLNHANLPFPNSICFHFSNYEEVNFNCIYLLRLLSVDLLWHTLKRLFLFTGQAFTCYIMKTQMKEWKYRPKWKKDVSLPKSFPHHIHRVEVTNSSRGVLVFLSQAIGCTTVCGSIWIYSHLCSASSSGNGIFKCKLSFYIYFHHLIKVEKELMCTLSTVSF